jgi:hypothetical protein
LNYVQHCQGVNAERGFVPYCPVPGLQGLLLGFASTAKNSPRKHSKLDNPDRTYQDYSYRVGSFIALSDPRPRLRFSLTAQNILSYSYLEKGFMSAVTCIFALDGRSMIFIATWTHNYTEMNQTQSEVQFNPTLFNVSANVTARSIVVTEVQSGENEIPALVVTNVMNSVNLLSRMSSSLYNSVLGDTMARDILNMRNRAADLNIVLDGDIVLAAVADSFSTIIDDILIGYGAAQIVFSNDSISTPLSITVDAVRIGDPIYIYATLGLNLLTLFLVLFETA